MRKVKEVLRLKYGHGLSLRKIAQCCGLARSTVADYLMRAEAAGIKWPLPENEDDAAIEARLFADRKQAGSQQRPMPDFKQVHEELQLHKHLTLQLVWREYKEAHPEGYQYSQFCDLYHAWRKKLDLVLRQTHHPGEKMFVDYAGDDVALTDPKTSEVTSAVLFVAVLGASSYTYAEATMKADLESWIGSHIRAFEYFGGSTAVVVPDNLKDGVKKPCRYEPDLNPTYSEMAAHYQVAVIPARVRKARDKAKVEAGVLLVERWILMALRKRTFFSLAELNQAIAELLVELNGRKFRKRAATRLELFEQLDRPALKPLPAERFEFAQWKWARVTNDYHVELDEHFYSVPSDLVGKKVELRYTAHSVEVLHGGVRVASHARSYEPGMTTVEQHRPESHRRYLEWTPTRLTSWADNVGPCTAALVEQIKNRALHPEQSLRSCLGLARLGQRYGENRLEAACARAVRAGACSYKSVESILNKRLDEVSNVEPLTHGASVIHDNIRGAAYFDQAEEGRHAD
jgi:transposase